MQHLTSPVALPSMPPLSGSASHLSVVTYNVLLPNSVDGWWNYKMYCPPLGDDRLHIASWDYRRNLLKERLALLGML